jgi:hypothetical protein
MLRELKPRFDLSRNSSSISPRYCTCTNDCQIDIDIVRQVSSRIQSSFEWSIQLALSASRRSGNFINQNPLNPSGDGNPESSDTETEPAWNAYRYCADCPSSVRKSGPRGHRPAMELSWLLRLRQARFQLFVSLLAEHRLEFLSDSLDFLTTLVDCLEL